MSLNLWIDAFIKVTTERRRRLIWLANCFIISPKLTMRHISLTLSIALLMSQTPMNDSIVCIHVSAKDCTNASSSFAIPTLAATLLKPRVPAWTATSKLAFSIASLLASKSTILSSTLAASGSLSFLPASSGMPSVTMGGRFAKPSRTRSTIETALLVHWSTISSISVAIKMAVLISSPSAISVKAPIDPAFSSPISWSRSLIKIDRSINVELFVVASTHKYLACCA
mmetsp:Transcript_3453/g.5761  ORF Transcript_3453/g.5761 Transcript_3453/m.5761 type:complete len:227 (-) Transcript_3453:1042-1722(-)